jgi:hypothetical protein
VEAIACARLQSQRKLIIIITIIINCSHTSESANVKVHYRVITGTSDVGTINSSDRMAAKLYSLGTLSQEYMYKYPS